MLEFYFPYDGVLKRRRSGALGGEMDRLPEHFFTLSYKRASAEIYLSRIARFSQFAGTRCGPKLTHQMSSIAICARLLRIFGALGQYRRWDTHRVAPERFIISAPSRSDALLLASFSNYLRRVRGLGPRTQGRSPGRPPLSGLVPPSPCRPRP